jgi:hypothetical protein
MGLRGCSAWRAMTAITPEIATMLLSDAVRQYLNAMMATGRGPPAVRGAKSAFKALVAFLSSAGVENIEQVTQDALMRGRRSDPASAGNARACLDRDHAGLNPVDHHRPQGRASPLPSPRTGRRNRLSTIKPAYPARKTSPAALTPSERTASSPPGRMEWRPKCEPAILRFSRQRIRY